MIRTINKYRNVGWVLGIFILMQFTSCNTASQENKPAISSENTLTTTGPEKGTLLLIGGSASDYFYDEFMRLIGGANQPIVVIPTALTSDVLTEDDLARFKQAFTDKGFTNVSVLHTRDTAEANRASFFAPVLQAKGVWFSGGRQWRHADSYLNTKTHEAFFDLLNRGGIIAGSSAGATIQGSFLARGDTKTNTIMAGDHQEGLGFISNVAVDQHMFARNRQFDMFEILAEQPGLLGIGLDENTGIIVKGNSFEVIGEHFVAIYDGTRWSADKDTIYRLAPNSKEFYVLSPGMQYDLKKRQVIIPEEN